MRFIWEDGIKLDQDVPVPEKRIKTSPITIAVQNWPVGASWRTENKGDAQAVYQALARVYGGFTSATKRLEFKNGVKGWRVWRTK